MLFSMVQLQHELDPRDCFMVMTLHDAVMLECREEMAGEYSVVVKQVMESLPLKKTFGVDLQVPIVSDVQVGQHWGEWEGEVDERSLVMYDG